MIRRKESESCESCTGYCDPGYLILKSTEGVCWEDSDHPVVDEDHWCDKYEYDGLPLIYLKTEESHVNSQQ